MAAWGLLALASIALYVLAFALHLSSEHLELIAAATAAAAALLLAEGLINLMSRRPGEFLIGGTVVIALILVLVRRPQTVTWSLLWRVAIIVGAAIAVCVLVILAWRRFPRSRAEAGAQAFRFVLLLSAFALALFSLSVSARLAQLEHKELNRTVAKHTSEICALQVEMIAIARARSFPLISNMQARRIAAVCQLKTALGGAGSAKRTDRGLAHRVLSRSLGAVEVGENAQALRTRLDSEIQVGTASSYGITCSGTNRQVR